jgi:hypothetical protein
MSATTQKNWRELCRYLHNEQESGNLMDMLSELNGALEQRVAEMTPLKVSAPPQQDSIPLLRRSVQP